MCRLAHVTFGSLYIATVWTVIESRREGEAVFGFARQQTTCCLLMRLCFDIVIINNIVIIIIMIEHYVETESIRRFHCKRFGGDQRWRGGSDLLSVDQLGPQCLPLLIKRIRSDHSIGCSFLVQSSIHSQHLSIDVYHMLPQSRMRKPKGGHKFLVENYRRLLHIDAASEDSSAGYSVQGVGKDRQNSLYILLLSERL